MADYALFRKCWNPKIDMDEAMTELEAEWKVPPADRPKFVGAMRNLDAWWEEGHKFEALDAADTALQELAADKQSSEFLIDLKDLVVVLTVLGEYHKDHADEVGRADFFPPPELVSKVYDLMRTRRIFEAYTVYEHWELRAREMIGQRLRWWLKWM